MIKVHLCLLCLILLSIKLTHASVSTFRLDANECEATMRTDDPVLSGTCQTIEACKPYMSLVPYVNPAIGPVCSKGRC